MFFIKGWRLHDFNVGVTDTDPTIESPNPSPSNYDLCGSYNGVVCDGGIVDMVCDVSTRGRYVIVQILGTSQVLTLCEVQVFESSK